MHLLFVCTGNTCRSPLAESIARQLVHERQLRDIEIRSAGTSANSNSPASDGSLLVALEEGLDLSAHRATELTTELVNWSDIVLVMSSQHLERIQDLGGAKKSYMLTDFASRGENSRPIGDPFGGDLQVYRETFSELVQEIGDVLDRVVSDYQQRSL